MAERFSCYIVVLTFCLIGPVSGQVSPVENFNKTAGTKEVERILMAKPVDLKFSKNIFFSTKAASTDIIKTSSVPHFKISPLRGQFPLAVEGFFCRQELKLEKTTSISFRFRLGSLEYTNWLEKKPNSRIYLR